MHDRKTLTRRAIRAALDVRRQRGICVSDPICVIDMAEQLGVSVRFTDEAASMEGMYLNAERPTILVCSLRPVGRQAMTCAHELGHHVFGHGTKVDEYLEQSQQEPPFDPEEWLADRFANFILMPKSAVLSAFRSRGIDVASPDPQSVFVVAGQLGVGYEALVNHLVSSLACVSRPVAEALRRHTPKQIRSELVGSEHAKHDVIVVDSPWAQTRPIDLQVGDYLIAPCGAGLDGNNATLQDSNGRRVVFRAVRPGISRLVRPGADWACFVRVSRQQYVGLGQYRHMEDPDHD